MSSFTFCYCIYTWLPKREAKEKKQPNSKEISIIWSNNSSNFQGPLSFLVAHDMTISYSPSRKLKRSKVFTCKNPSKRAKIYASMAKPWPANLENVFSTMPKWSWSNPPILNCPPLPKEHPLKFGLAKPIRVDNHSKSPSLVNLMVFAN